MVRLCRDDEFDVIYSIINDAAEAYRNVIPDDCWHTPYMGDDELRREFQAGVVFSVEERGDKVLGVMGLQEVADVTLIRHAYVRTEHQGKGIGGTLLSALKKGTTRPLLIGTWAAAAWAISFYESYGFRSVDVETKEKLLSTYWSVSIRQAATSVVLADAKWWESVADSP